MEFYSRIGSRVIKIYLFDAILKRLTLIFSIIFRIFEIFWNFGIFSKKVGSYKSPHRKFDVENAMKTDGVGNHKTWHELLTPTPDISNSHAMGWLGWNNENISNGNRTFNDNTFSCTWALIFLMLKCGYIRYFSAPKALQIFFGP